MISVYRSRLERSVSFEPRAGRVSPRQVRRACARGSKFGQDASLTHVASRRARAVRAKYRLAGLTTWLGERIGDWRMALFNFLFVCSLPSNPSGSIEDAARDGPCAHGKDWRPRPRRRVNQRFICLQASEIVFCSHCAPS